MKTIYESTIKNQEIWVWAYHGNEELPGYKVSNLGRIRSYWEIKRINNKFSSSIGSEFKILKPTKSNKGYEYVTVMGGKKFFVHRIVVDSFFPIEPSEKQLYKLQIEFQKNKINPESHKSKSPLKSISDNEWNNYENLDKNELENIIKKYKIEIAQLLQIDHVNTQKSDNNICNLERVTPKGNSSSFKRNFGASKNKKELDKKNQFALIDPHGKIIVSRGMKGFCKQRGLDRRSIFKLINEKAKTHKGWKLAKNYYVGNKLQISLLRKDGLI